MTPHAHMPVPNGDAAAARDARRNRREWAGFFIGLAVVMTAFLGYCLIVETFFVSHEQSKWGYVVEEEDAAGDSARPPATTPSVQEAVAP